MKTLKALTCLSLIALSSPAFAQIKIVSEGTVDLNNLGEDVNGHKANPAHYGVPSKLLHTYIVRNTITLEEGIVAEAKRAQVPETEECSGGSGESGGIICSPVAPHVEVNLVFRSTEAKAVYELIDGESGKIIGTHQENLTIALFNKLFAGDSERLQGTFSLPSLGFEKADFGMHVDFPLLPKVSKKRMILSTDGLGETDRERFAGAKIEVERVDENHYRLKQIRLDSANVAKTYIEQDPMFDPNYERFGHYLYVRGVGETSVYYPRALKSFTN